MRRMTTAQLWGLQLQILREGAGFRSPQTAAEASGISRQHIYKIEAGTTNPPISTYLQLISLYGYTFAKFVASLGYLLRVEERRGERWSRQNWEALLRLLYILRRGGKRAQITRVCVDAIRRVR